MYLKLIIGMAIGVGAGAVMGQFLLNDALSGVGAGLAFGTGLGLGVHALTAREEE